MPGANGSYFLKTFAGNGFERGKARKLVKNYREMIIRCTFPAIQQANRVLLVKNGAFNYTGYILLTLLLHLRNHQQ